ncbi:hypothetical protein B0I35DRAFT_472934 [Stachybotrys elegans]|uniref:PH domain-containing protein n=1 Tax=Stachybotrys elegans TaxID=80388 RepID=A0A8K0T155_9HYPO|nr:hypothetical protein B0I35DRAFT_472934 [Stachybotrys elegans]
MAHILAYDSLSARPTTLSTQRPRPHDTNPEDRVALRSSQKASRRESRLGLRTIFGRPRTSNSDASPPSHLTDSLRSASLSSDVPTSHSRPASIAPGSAYGPGDSSEQLSISSGLASLDLSWAPPPLFKAYPRAIRDATLPASTLDADYIVRLNSKSTGDAGFHAASDQRTAEKVRKKHRQTLSLTSTKLEWTTKIYILETSGYLLQYAAEGAHDRTPEKILQLGRSSAAFASDVIPGKHWVLQVSSVVESESQPTESRSLFSKLHIRSGEKQKSTNMLLIFESAEDMDGWMTTLRREIERLGGKRSLSETGAPKEIEEALHPTPMRNPVPRSSNRYSLYADNSSKERFDRDEFPVMAHDVEGFHEGVDDTSTTDSLVSHDERQLDNLRNSANRLSYHSSGQRTIVTSAGSSPACSPSRETFNIPPQDLLPPKSEARLRPNASAILYRRSSLQMLSPFVEHGANSSAAPPQNTTLENDAQADAGPSPVDPPQPPLNFSVPRSSNRRFSTYRIPTGPEPDGPSPQHKGGSTPHRVGARKPPPAQLRSTRPLSMVMDLPSPQADIADRPATRHDTSDLHISTDPVPPPPPPRSASRPRPRPPLSHAIHRPKSPLHHGKPIYGNPRRMASLGSISRQDVVPQLSGAQYGIPQSKDAAMSTGRRSNIQGPALADDAPSAPLISPRTLKRASMHSMVSDRSSRHEATMDNYASFMTALPPLRAPPPLMPLPPLPGSKNGQQLNMEAASKALLNRRSMPHLMDGPPPAPPPVCALPPIPHKPNF